MHSVICSGLGSLECFVIIKCTKFGQLILRKIIKIVATTMSDFKTKMHQIRFRLGLHPRSCWGSLQRSPDSQLDLRGLLLTGRRGGEGKEREGKEGVRKKGKGWRGEMEGRGKRSPCSDFTI